MTDEPVRVLIVGLPRLLGEMIEQTLSAEPDFQVLTADGNGGDFAEAVAQEAPDFAIVALEDGNLPQEWRTFLDERARIRVLGIGPVDGRAALHKLRPEQVVLGEVSPEQVVAAIRAAAPKS